MGNDSKLREALEVASGDLHMMKLAVEADDPKREILCRIGDAKKVIDDALAAIDGAEPVAWMYERGGPFPVRYIHDQRTPAYLEPVDHGFGITSGEWTETPLYADPLTTQEKPG